MSYAKPVVNCDAFTGQDVGAGAGMALMSAHQLHAELGCARLVAKHSVKSSWYSLLLDPGTFQALLPTLPFGLLTLASAPILPHLKPVSLSI